MSRARWTFPVVLLLIAGLAATGCGDGESGSTARRDAPADLDALLRRAFGGEIPETPTSSDGRVGSVFERAKDLARAGSGKVAEPPTEEEIAEVADLTLREFGSQFERSSSADDGARVERIVGRILRGLPAGSTKTYTWTLFESETINAFMGPGGQGMVLTGILRALPRDDDLAFVLAHEVAHGELGHVEEKIHTAKAGWVAGEKIERMAGGRLGTDRMPELLAKLSNVVVTAVYDQDQEFEADRLGLALAWRAGYDPEGSIRSMEALAGEQAHATSRGVRRIAYDVIGTHPPTGARIEYFREMIGKLAER